MHVASRTCGRKARCHLLRAILSSDPGNDTETCEMMQLRVCCSAVFVGAITVTTVTACSTKGSRTRKTSKAASTEASWEAAAGVLPGRATTFVTASVESRSLRHGALAYLIRCDSRLRKRCRWHLRRG